MSDWLITFMGDGVHAIDGVGIFQRYTTAAVTETVASTLAGDDRWRIRGPGGETEAPGADPAPVKTQEPVYEPAAPASEPESEPAPVVAPEPEPEPEPERPKEKAKPTPKGDLKPTLSGDKKASSRVKRQIRTKEDAKPGR